jgi:hypothetical protein
VAPVVRKVDIALRACLRRDGIDVPVETEGRFKFAHLRCRVQHGEEAPIVRKAAIALRASLRRDGIDVPAETEGRFKFAQYEATRRSVDRFGRRWASLVDYMSSLVS